MLKRSFHTTNPPAPTPAGVVAAGAGLVAVSYGVVRFGYGLHLPRLTEEFQLSAGTAGLIASGSFLAYCLAALTGRTLIGHGRARAVLWTAAGLAAVGATVVAASWTTPVLALGVLVAGGAAGAASPALVVAVDASVPGPAAARAQALVNAGTGVGVAAAGAGVLLAPTLWRPVWGAAAVLALVLAVVVDRRTRWPARSGTGPGSRQDLGPRPGVGADRSPADTRPIHRLAGPVLAAVLAGVGSAAVWTFGRDLLSTTAGLPERTTAVLWCLLGVAAVLGALSGDAVRVLGLRRAWVLSATLTAAGTAVLALVPSAPVAAAAALAVFGGAYTALSGVLIAWAAVLDPEAAGSTTATLFTALTLGQAAGAAGAGQLAGLVGLPGAFLVGAATLLATALLGDRVVRPRRARPAA